MKKIFRSTIVLALLLIPCGCEEPEPTEQEIILEWIWEVMNDIYLWADEVEPDLYPPDETDPEVFFESILNEKDRFSWIVDDYQELLNSFNNISLSSGISPAFVRIHNSDQVVIIVEYVAKGSPAEAAGVQRGDIITEINGQTISVDNYVDLFYKETLVLGFADYTNTGLVKNDRVVSVTAEVIEENPLIHHQVIEYADRQIGYMAYTGFSPGEQDKWLDSINLVFARYLEEGITDIVMDIRYNSGGSMAIARHLASVLAPASVIASNDPFVLYKWNRDYQEYFRTREGDHSKNLVLKFDEDPVYNLDLERVYFLTTGHSASASELLITGLEPHMDVIQIGENTFGKCYGSITIPDIEEPPRHSWAMQPIVFKYANAVGYTDFDEGLEPDVFVEENIVDLKPFGDISDPMLSKAIEMITGTAPITQKSAMPAIDYTLLPDPVREKRQTIIDQPVFQDLLPR